MPGTPAQVLVALEGPIRFAPRLFLACLFLASGAQGFDRIYLSSTHCIREWSQIPAFQLITVDVMAHSTDGFTTAEFALTGFSAPLFVTFTPNPAAIEATGDPAAGGARIVFEACQTDPVLLYTATVFAWASITPAFGLASPASPVDPQFPCPNLTRCDNVAKVCLATGSLLPSAEQVVLAPGNPQPADGAVNVRLEAQLSVTSGGCCHAMFSPCFSLWFGTDSGPPFLGGMWTYDRLLQPGPFAPATRYYWRVQVNSCTVATGPVWSFHHRAAHRRRADDVGTHQADSPRLAPVGRWSGGAMRPRA